MGDLVSPRRRDVYDRLRRRIEQYRHHQQVRLNRVEPPANGLYEHQRQETLLLQQRWLESKAKRAAKNSKSSRDSNSQHNSNQLSKLKRKLDNQPNLNPIAPGDNLPVGAIDHYKFEDQSSPPHKKPCQQAPNNSGPPPHPGGPGGDQKGEAKHCVSVNIDLQQISNSQSVDTSSQIQLTVKSTLHTGGNNNNSASTSASLSTNTNICKQEPEQAQAANNHSQDINNPQTNSSNSSQGSFPETGLDFDGVGFDELNDILTQLEKEEGGLPPELLKELDLGRLGAESQDSTTAGSNQAQTSQKQDTQDFNKVANTSSATNPSLFTGDSVDASHQVKKGSPASGMFADPIYDNSNSAIPTSYGMGGPGAASMTGYTGRPPTGHGTAGPSPPIGTTPGEIPPLPPLGDTGPAAETLKQMAAHHQNQEWTGGKSAPAMTYGADGYPEGYRRQMSYPGYPANYMASAGPQQQQGMYPYNHQMGQRAPFVGPAAAMPGNMKAEMPAGYAGTKPLTHFSPESSPSPAASGSSLQRLQDQVSSQFSQAPSHPGMAPSGPAGQMQMSQSQQMHLSTQQQGHSMQLSASQQMHVHSSGGAGSGPPGSNISMNQHQSFSMGPQYGGQGMPPGMTPQMYQEKMAAHGQMQQYNMGSRPPPDYKMPAGVPNNYPAQQQGQPTMSAANPLQTMQNMVNQTSQNMQQAGQGAPNGTGQQHSMPGVTRASPQPTPGAPPTQAGYPPRPPMVGSQPMVNGVGRGSKPEQTNYTSTIMRGQRPPNVNVGPEGLNISQQRPADWPRPMMGPGGHPGQMNRPQGAAMMQYGSYGNQAGMARARMHMAQQPGVMGMHPQQRTMGGMHGEQAMHPGMRGPHPEHMQQHVMMGQHQRMQMQNGQAMAAASMSMSQSASMGVTNSARHPGPPAGGAQQGAAPHSQPGGPSAPQHGGNGANPSASGSGPHGPGQYPHQAGAQNPGGSEFALDFLDNAQGQNADFFDSNPSDFNFIDDILSGK